MFLNTDIEEGRKEGRFRKGRKREAREIELIIIKFYL